jgi:UDP-N-acetylglucosamine acyltransferase
MGRGNVLDAFVVLGGPPQDLKFLPATVSYVRIGDRNVFREGVTISRATGEGKVTTVGSRTYWMTGSHAGHNATVEDDAILVNGSGLGGFATLGRRAILSSHVMIHQFCRIGESVMTQGNSGISMHVPPFCLVGIGINRVIGLNIVGMRRSKELTDEDRRQIKEAFGILYRSGLPRAKAMERMDACTDWGSPAGRFRDFVRRAMQAGKPYDRGIIPLRRPRPRPPQQPDTPVVPPENLTPHDFPTPGFRPPIHQARGRIGASP